MKKQNGSIDQEKVDTSNEAAEPEEPDECALGNGNSLEIFLRRALNVTNGKLYIYKVCSGRSMRGKSVEDFVQDGFVEYLASGKIICTTPFQKSLNHVYNEKSVQSLMKCCSTDTNDISALKEIIEHVSNALKKASNSKEVRLIKNSFTGHLEDPTPPQQRQMADNELNKKLAMVFDKFYTRLPSNKKRAINAIVNADFPEMLKLFTPKYNEILEHLVKFGYLNEDYTRDERQL